MVSKATGDGREETKRCVVRYSPLLQYSELEHARARARGENRRDGKKTGGAGTPGHTRYRFKNGGSRTHNTGTTSDWEVTDRLHHQLTGFVRIELEIEYY